MGKEGKWNDRHNIPRPDAGLGKQLTTNGSDAAKSQGVGKLTVNWSGWRNGCRDRIADLFKTVKHLESHAQEVQTKFRSLSNCVNDGSITDTQAKALFKEMCDCIKKAADGTTPTDLDQVGGEWGPLGFSCDAVNCSATIVRQSGKIIYQYRGG